MGVDAGTEQQVIVASALPRQVIVGNENFGAVVVKLACAVQWAIHGQDHGRRYMAGVFQPGRKPLQNQVVTQLLQLDFCNTESLEKKTVADIAAQGRRNQATTAAGSDSGGVAMNVDDRCRGLHEEAPIIGVHHTKSAWTWR